MNATDIKQKMEIVKTEQPNLRARDIANEIGVSEAELLAAQVGGGIIRLRDEFEEILKSIEPLGEVMALTRNEACVHERKGVYANPKFFSHGKMKNGLFVNPDIDLRLFMSHWSFVFAVSEDSKAGERNSLQFFDKSGVAIHKIYLTNHSNKAEFEALVTLFKAENQETEIIVTPYDEKPSDRPDSEIDWDGLRKAWENLKDTHDFFPMLRKFKVGRQQSLRKIGADLAYEVDNTASRQVLDIARETECEIMVFTGNRACIQIHTGTVNKLLEHSTWYNVLDPKFNLHLNEKQISATWVTRKPTEDGIITAVEVFDENGEMIVTFFGKRKPGVPELELWREIVSRLSPREVTNAA